MHIRVAIIGITNTSELLESTKQVTSYRLIYSFPPSIITFLTSDNVDYHRSHQCSIIMSIITILTSDNVNCTLIVYCNGWVATTNKIISLHNISPSEPSIPKSLVSNSTNISSFCFLPFSFILICFYYHASIILVEKQMPIFPTIVYLLLRLLPRINLLSCLALGIYLRVLLRTCKITTCTKYYEAYTCHSHSYNSSTTPISTYRYIGLPFSSS